jgi:hypothetical protein
MKMEKLSWSCFSSHSLSLPDLKCLTGGSSGVTSAGTEGPAPLGEDFINNKGGTHFGCTETIYEDVCIVYV